MLRKKKKYAVLHSVSVHAWSVGCIQLFEILRTVACQAPLSEISQAKILEWVTIPFSKGSSQPRDQTHIPYVAGRVLTV